MPALAIKHDERTTTGAYLKSGANLYYVLGLDSFGRVMLEDCKTLCCIHVLPSHVWRECQLVRAAA